MIFCRFLINIFGNGFVASFGQEKMYPKKPPLFNWATNMTKPRFPRRYNWSAGMGFMAVASGMGKCDSSQPKNGRFNPSNHEFIQSSVLPKFARNGVFHDFPHKNRRFHQHKNGSFHIVSQGRQRSLQPERTKTALGRSGSNQALGCTGILIYNMSIIIMLYS